MKLWIKFVGMAVVLLGTVMVSAEDFSFINDTELAAELQARQTDLARVTNRIAAQKSRLLQLRETIRKTKSAQTAIDQQIQSRTYVLYRLSRNGKSVKYLSSSKSAMGFMKRMYTLKNMITGLMDERRGLALALAAAEEDTLSLERDIKNGAAMLHGLNATVVDLQAELDKRQQ